MKLIFENKIYEAPVLICYAIKELLYRPAPYRRQIDKVINYLTTYRDGTSWEEIEDEEVHKNAEKRGQIENLRNLYVSGLKVLDDKLKELDGWIKFSDERPADYRLCEYLISTDECSYERGAGVYFPEACGKREHFYFDKEIEEVAAIVYWKYIDECSERHK